MAYHGVTTSKGLFPWDHYYQGAAFYFEINSKLLCGGLSGAFERDMKHLFLLPCTQTIPPDTMPNVCVAPRLQKRGARSSAAISTMLELRVVFATRMLCGFAPT